MDLKCDQYQNNNDDDEDYENLSHNTIKFTLESQILNIRTEASSKTKKIAKELCCQKFLAILYRDKFDRWVDLVDYYDKKMYKNDRSYN